MKLNPITRKRLNRFRRLRRAFVSFWLLVAVVLLALGADLICNANPLYVRFNGRHYFPAFRFYPESAFIPHGNPTAPDYKQLNQTAAFRENKGNFMLFTPVPFGPRETIDEQSIRAERDTAIILLPIPRAGNLDLTADLHIARQLAAGYFLGREGEEVAGCRSISPGRSRVSCAKRCDCVSPIRRHPPSGSPSPHRPCQTCRWISRSRPSPRAPRHPPRYVSRFALPAAPPSAAR